MPQVWQDRELRFDVPRSALACRRGEFEIDSINSVEDTKGNNGERGFLIVTNLRMIWADHKNSSTNLSIGYDCITNMSIKVASSRLRGNTQALYIMTKFSNSRFEFIFTSLVKQSPRLFTTVQAVYRAYETTKLYRDLKLRGAIIKDKQLTLLPQEQVYNKVTGVWNLSSDQGNLGTFFVTNIRLVWHANLAENFNVSIPYLQMKSIRLRESKFGPALVIETRAQSGGYILGFRLDPEERLQEIHSELRSLYRVYALNPVFGIEFTVEEKPDAAEKRLAERTEDGVEIVDVEDGMESLAAYYADGDKSKDADPVFSAELGLAVESLPDGFTVGNLWLLY